MVGVRIAVVALVLAGACVDRATEEPAPTRDELDALCPEQTTREDCEAVPEDVHGTSFCAWETWVRVARHDANGCGFGEVEHACRRADASDGCDGPQTTCAPYRKVAWDGTRLGFSDGWCYPPFAACGGDGQESTAPECACACDPAFLVLE